MRAVGRASEAGKRVEDRGRDLTKTSNEIDEIQQELARLQARLQAIDDAPPVESSVTAAPRAEHSSADTASSDTTSSDPVSTEATVPDATEATSLPSFRTRSADAGLMPLTRAGLAELNGLQKVAEFPDFFARLARKTGLRMLLLKRWKSGLQVFMESGIKLPAEAKQKRSDGRAPIPLAENDVFEAIGREAAIYVGPVPVKHFPLDLTLMLGRGARERQIVILPLPAKNHWNTFIYLDADRASEQALGVAEVLAQYALARMSLLHKGERSRQGRVAGILKTELHRRQKSHARRVRMEQDGDAEIEGDSSAALPVDAPDASAGAGPSSGGARERVEEQAVPAEIREAGAHTHGVGEQAAEIIANWEQSLKNHGGTQSAEKTDETARSDGDRLPELAATVPPQRCGESSEQPESREQCTLAAGGASPEAWSGEDAAAAQDGELATSTQQLEPEDILHSSGELPALPKAACHIMAVIDDPHTTATKLEQAIALDQALTAKVLRIANSPFYGAVREIKTVSEAIVRLGFVTIRNWTLVTATKSIFLAPGAGLLFQKIWRQSVLSAMASQLVAQAVQMREPEAVFIGGLMQNIGQLVLARSRPELFQSVLEISADQALSYHVVERRLLGFDHGTLGALLIKEWNLSQDLEEAVRWHHRLDEDEAQNKRVAAMIAVGEELAACSGSGPDAYAESEEEGQGPPAEMRPSAAASYLGISSTTMASLQEQACNLRIDPAFFS